MAPQSGVSEERRGGGESSNTGLVVALVLVVVVCLHLSASWPAAAAPDVPYCQPGQSPAFAFGIAALHDRLGDTMGTPLECEHLDADNGDTVQRTTSGLAYYRPSINTTMFTDGSTHWALAEGALMRWQGASVTLAIKPLTTPSCSTRS